MNKPVRLSHVDLLSDTATLSNIAGVQQSWQRERLTSAGFSGAVIERLTGEAAPPPSPSFILKCVDLRADWFSVRTHDSIGREAAVLAAREFESIWDYWACPYRALALEPGNIGMLMDDLGAGLFPNTREPIGTACEDLIIDAIAGLHARFWQMSNLENKTWLLSPAQYCDMMGPAGDATHDRIAAPPENIAAWMRDGWRVAHERLPAHLQKLLTHSGAELTAGWNTLPTTLLHGDLKLANMARVPQNRIALFDWAFVGSGPCTIDVGWYLAVNATRLAESKESFVQRYRQRLEFRLGRALPESVWHNLYAAGIVSGARMLLWSKALNLAKETPGAQREWEWWIAQLEQALSI